MRGVIVGAVLTVAVVTVVVAAQPAPQTPPPCVATGDVQFVCGQQAPEDLVVCPAASGLLPARFSARAAST